jgi:hypothetical protein
MGALMGLAAPAHADILVRWDRDHIPSRDSLGVSTVVVPAANRTAVRNAIAEGYGVVLEVDAKTLASVVLPTRGLSGVIVKGTPAAATLTALRTRLDARGLPLRVLDERGKWPHIRSNMVTSNNGVLQVSSRTQQPWMENNVALMRIAQVAQPDTTPLLTYAWPPTTVADADEGPSLDDYLVAMAEAGSFGADLVLPLHQRLQNDLLLGTPSARADWKAVRDAIAFYAWNLSTRYRPTANIGVIAADAMRWFEVMNLLARHNLSFVPLGASIGTRDLSAFDLLIVLDDVNGRDVETLSAFARKGGTVVLVGMKGVTADAGNAGKGRVIEHKPIENPDTFALEIRQVLGRDRRVIQIWNGITVLAQHFTSPAPRTVLLTLVNYSHQDLPVQLRVPGTFSSVHYESPEAAPALLPYQHRDGFTEFVVPALHVGGRVFLTESTIQK